MALLQSLRDVATSSAHGLFAHWEADLILDRIKPFLADDDLLRYERKNQPQEEEPTDGTMTMETTWSSAPSTPRGETRRRCLQVAGTFAATSSARNTDDLFLPMFQWTRIRQ